MRPKSVEIQRYAGGNETIDRLKSDDEEVWVVNARKGRKVLILPPGSSPDDAWEAYKARFLAKDDEEE